MPLNFFMGLGVIGKMEDRKGKHITENERYIIETMLKDGRKPKEIAARIGRHWTTVYREIKRGTVQQRASDYTDYHKYCADTAQRIYDDNSRNKGISLKIGSDFKTVELIEDLIINKKYSPYAVSVMLHNLNAGTTLCAATIYSYIHNGFLLNVSDENLSYKVKKTKKDREKSSRRPSYKMLGAKTIEERPKHVCNRNTYGHWEMDTVVSGKKKSKCCLLVLSERMTRQEIIRKLPDRTADSVLNEVNNIEKLLGFNSFRNIFKTITCDNGVEFAKYKELEISCTVVGCRTSLYFCHPFCSGERGTNENTNKLIRKFVPKGCDISEYSNEDIKHIEDLINDYPRKLFGGLSSNEIRKRNNL